MYTESRRVISPWSVPKLILKLIQSLIKFILSDQIASIMTHLKQKWTKPLSLFYYCLQQFSKLITTNEYFIYTAKNRSAEFKYKDSWYKPMCTIM